MTYLNILFGTDLPLKFRLRNTSIASRWSEQLQLAQSLSYPIDDPERFYGFNSQEDETKKALRLINNSINTINSYRLLIDRQLRDVDDQDTLNYLHHIFEVYHGLLDTQSDNEFFRQAPATVRQALADLNIHVHRCESVARGARPRVVITYYGLPKTQTYEPVDYLHFTSEYQFGTVYINYVEIGKTLEDLAQDQDRYIADNAFRPFNHFSADFNLRFFTVTQEQAQIKNQLTQNYYHQHRTWFQDRGYSPGDYRLSPGQCPVADLESNLSESEVLDLIRSRQLISRVWLS